MKAALLEAIGRMTMVDIDPPTIQDPQHVMIQIKTVGVCGSEVHAFEGTHPYRKPPSILGHEVAGVVSSVGEAVRRFKPGDRVIVDPQWPCGECAYCQAGDINLCPSKVVLGTPAWPGGFGEYIVSPEEAVFNLPDSLTFAEGSLIEPLTVGVHLARRANLQAGQSVAILGSGSIGGLLSGVSHTHGANPIIVADVKQHCMDAARERLGATHDILLPDDQLISKVKQIAGGEGVDMVFVAADDVDLVPQAIQMVKRRGVVVLVALLTEAPLKLTAYDMIGREIHMIGSNMCNNDDVVRAIQLAETRQVDVSAIHTHTLPIEQAQRGMELAHTKDDGAIKVILTFE
jgi:L-iditol 2-dehydrogenase